MPLHPGVIDHFGLTWAGPATRFRFLSEAYLSFEEWVGRFLRCEAYPDVSRGVEAVLHEQPGAEDMFNQAAALLPDSALVAYARGILALRGHRNDEALQMLLGLATHFPDLPRIHAHLAECYAALGDRQAEELALRQALVRNAHVRGLYIRLATVLRAQGRPDEAAVTRRQAEALAPPRPRASMH